MSRLTLGLRLDRRAVLRTAPTLGIVIVNGTTARFDALAKDTGAPVLPTMTTGFDARCRPTLLQTRADSPVRTVIEKTVPAFSDIPYVANGGDKRVLDIYLPESSSESATPESGSARNSPVPVVVWIHGGGWVGGQKRLSLPYLVDDGYATVTINYRLLQDAMWPAQIVDANAAISWVWRHADDYGFDRNRLVVAGGSAGGRSASIVAASANNRVADFAADPEVRIAALIDFFGGTESEYEFAHNPDRTALIDESLTPDQVAEMQRQIDVRTYIDGDDPPTLIVHGDQDRTVPIEEGRELAAAFKSAGVPVTFAEMPGRGHGLQNYQDDAVQQIVRTFLSETLGPVRSG